MITEAKTAPKKKFPQQLLAAVNRMAEAIEEQNEAAAERKLAAPPQITVNAPTPTVRVQMPAHEASPVTVEPPARPKGFKMLITNISPGVRQVDVTFNF